MLSANFFENFSKKNYFEFYKSHDKIEDIILKEDESIDFKINYLENKYILALVAMIEVIFSKYNRKNLIRYLARCSIEHLKRKTLAMCIHIW